MLLPPATSAASTLAFIDGLGGPEIVLILIVALLLFGGKGLPNAARTLGRTMREFKKATSGFEDEIKKAMHEVEDEVETVTKPRPPPAARLMPADSGLPGRAAAAETPPPAGDATPGTESSADSEPAAPKPAAPAQPPRRD